MPYGKLQAIYTWILTLDFRSTGILLADLRRDPRGALLVNLQTGVPSRTWEDADYRLIIHEEIIPRLRRAKNIYQRLRYRKSNTISEEWYQATR